jgi:hypothetical protein
MNDKKYEIATTFEIFEVHGTKLKVPKDNDYGREGAKFSSSETLEEAQNDILQYGDSYIDYTILPIYRKVSE